jgi:hypothetical protein
MNGSRCPASSRWGETGLEASNGNRSTSSRPVQRRKHAVFQIAVLRGLPSASTQVLSRAAPGSKCSHQSLAAHATTVPGSPNTSIRLKTRVAIDLPKKKSRPIYKGTRQDVSDVIQSFEPRCKDTFKLLGLSSGTARRARCCLQSVRESSKTGA